MQALNARSVRPWHLFKRRVQPRARERARLQLGFVHRAVSGRRANFTPRVASRQPPGLQAQAMARVAAPQIQVLHAPGPQQLPRPRPRPRAARQPYRRGRQGAGRGRVGLCARVGGQGEALQKREFVRGRADLTKTGGGAGTRAS
jgi:hypothetical protein